MVGCTDNVFLASVLSDSDSDSETVPYWSRSGLPSWVEEGVGKGTPPMVLGVWHNKSK